MGRPTQAPTIPPQATLPDEAHLPDPMTLPDMPDLGSAPDFPPLGLPSDAAAGINMALEVVPDFILDLG